MDSKDKRKDASFEAWEELSRLLNEISENSGGGLAFSRPDEFSVLIQEKQPPRVVRIEYSPELKKVRYNTGASGWQELKAVESPQKEVLFKTPYDRKFSVKQLSGLVLEQLRKSPF